MLARVGILALLVQRLEAVGLNAALDDEYYAEALPLVDAGGEFKCRIPAPETLVYKQADNATEQLRALSVAGVLEAGRRRARQRTGTYKPHLVKYALGGERPILRP